MGPVVLWLCGCSTLFLDSADEDLPGGSSARAPGGNPLELLANFFVFVTYSLGRS